jgi:hypothetical protein
VFGTLLGKTTGWLDQRLITTVLLPALAFWTGVGALVATHVGWTTTINRWKDLDGPRQLLVAGGAVVALVLFAVLAQTLLPGMIRLYEGYWLRDTAVGAWMIARHKHRWDNLDLTKPRDFTRRYQHFPPEEAGLLPTRLGNVMRAAELYAADQSRYGIDAVFFWPRLYPLLPDPLRASLDAARASTEQQLFTATLSGTLTVVTGVFAIALDLPASVWSPVLLGSALLAWVTHRTATRVAVSYAELVRSAFDTHRRALLTAMGLELPATLDDERKLWKALGQQLYRRDSDQPELLKLTVES